MEAERLRLVRGGQRDEDPRFFYDAAGDEGVPEFRSRRKKMLDWEETETERNRFIANVFGVLAFQLGAAAAASYVLPKQMPPQLTRFLKADPKGVLKLAGASAGAWSLSTLILAVSGPLRRTLPFNFLLLLAQAAGLAGLSLSSMLQFPIRWPWLFLSQSAGALLLSSLLARRGSGEGFAPYLISALVALAPARPMQLLLKWDIKEVTVAGACAFLLAVVLAYSTQAGMKRRVLSSSLDGAAMSWIDLMRGGAMRPRRGFF